MKIFLSLFWQSFFFFRGSVTFVSVKVWITLLIYIILSKQQEKIKRSVYASTSRNAENFEKQTLFLLSNSFMVFSPSCDDSKPFHIWKWPRAGVVSFCCCRLAASWSETATVPCSFCTVIKGRGKGGGDFYIEGKFCNNNF